MGVISDGTTVIDNGAVEGVISWQSSIVTGTTLSAVAGNGYWINTTSNACTITLPASASAGDTIVFVDYLRTWGTNAVTLNQNSLNFQGHTSPNPEYNTDGQSVKIVYSGATQGWIPTVDDDVTYETDPSYPVDFLVIAGGGGGGSNYGGGGGAGGYRTSTQSVNSGTVYTITVGGGGTNGSQLGGNGTASSISGSGLSTISSAGGGGGNGLSGTGGSGGSGGGGGGGGPGNPGGAGGSGNTPSTSPSQGNNGGAGSSNDAGGGGGAGEAGNTDGTSQGGDGTASSITGSSVTRAGGGGGRLAGGGGAAGGDGGGASGTTNATVNSGSGGAGAVSGGQGTAASGVVILSLPTARYTGTTTVSPTVTTSGSNTILQFNGSGSYTA